MKHVRAAAAVDARLERTRPGTIRPSAQPLATRRAAALAPAFVRDVGRYPPSHPCAHAASRSELFRPPEGGGGDGGSGAASEDAAPAPPAADADADAAFEPRCVHVGVDLGGPVDTPVYSFCDGRVIYAGYNPTPGDYGNCIVALHHIEKVREGVG